MEILTSRFGPIEMEADDVIHFPTGLLGLADCRDWVLLADARNDALAWLQNVQRPDVALAVVSPRRFITGYQMRVARRELVSLELSDVSRAEVLAILGKTTRAITLNLKAPVVINLDRRLGRQVIANGDLPVRYELGGERSSFRRSA